MDCVKRTRRSNTVQGHSARRITCEKDLRDVLGPSSLDTTQRGTHAKSKTPSLRQAPKSSHEQRRVNKQQLKVSVLSNTIWRLGSLSRVHTVCTTWWDYVHFDSKNVENIQHREKKLGGENVEKFLACFSLNETCALAPCVRTFAQPSGQCAF